MKWKVVKNRYFKSSSHANSTNTGTASVDFSKIHPFLQHHFVFFVSHGKSVPGLRKKTVNNTVAREKVFFSLSVLEETWFWQTPKRICDQNFPLREPLEGKTLEGTVSLFHHKRTWQNWTCCFVTLVVLSAVSSPTQPLKGVSLANREENSVYNDGQPVLNCCLVTRCVEELQFSVPLHFFLAKTSSTTRSAVENWSYTQVTECVNSFIPHLNEISARGSSHFGKKVHL